MYNYKYSSYKQTLHISSIICACIRACHFPWESLRFMGKHLTAIQKLVGTGYNTLTSKYPRISSFHVRGTLQSQPFLLLLPSEVASCQRLIDSAGWVVTPNDGNLNPLRNASHSKHLYQTRFSDCSIFGSHITQKSSIEVMGTRICGPFETRC